MYRADDRKRNDDWFEAVTDVDKLLRKSERRIVRLVENESPES